VILLWVAFLLGCEGAGAVFYGVGKVHLDRKRAPIYITDHENEVVGCDFVKQVCADTAWGGFTLQEEAIQNLIGDLSHQAHRAGADVLLVRYKSKSFIGASVAGEAYRCKNGRAVPRSGQ
jgi:hypothetical protein